MCMFTGSGRTDWDLLQKVRSAIRLAVASGTLIGPGEPSTAAPISRPTGSMRYVCPPRFFRRTQMAPDSLDFSGYDLTMGTQNSSPQAREFSLGWN